jgi:hypothetical protein
MPRSWLRGRSDGIATSALIVPGRAVMQPAALDGGRTHMGVPPGRARRRGLVWHTVC